jgi:site-specific recombinase XerD
MESVDLKALFVGTKPGGCVESHLKAFAADLISAGYAKLPVQDYVRSAAHLGRWMDLRKLGLEQLGEEVIAEFAQHECACHLASRRGLRPAVRYVKRVRRFVMYLARQKVIPPLAQPKPRPAPTPLVGFSTWMTQHRGLKQRTVQRYVRLIEEMLPVLGHDTADYDAAHIRRVLLQTIKPLSLGYAKTYVTALRAFLRFLAVQGKCRSHLDRAVPTVPEWKLSTLPRYLERDDIDSLIASCDLRKPVGIRDRAILLLMVRLGLRAGDIIAMRLDDLDWDSGTVRVLGKGRKEVRLPLAQDAGEALIEYLVKARPAANSDHVFFCTNAPLRPIRHSPTISGIVHSALRRAGLVNAPSKGAHLLRHSAATAMLRSGASLDAIATVLRHQSTDTTAYYAKIDIQMLSEITQPWPEDLPC